MTIQHARFDVAPQADPVLPERVHGVAPALTLAFVGASSGLEAATQRLQGALKGPVIACTTAGELDSSGLREDAIVGVALSGDLSVHQEAVPDLAALDSQALMQITDRLRRAIAARPPGTSTFGIVVVDGLSVAEERLMAALGSSLPTVEFVGGSAGDGLRFERTGVWWEGAFRSDMAVITLVHTTQPWRTLKTQHFRPSEHLLVITDADPDRRVVHEIDGMPAAQAYALAVGVPVDQLGPQVFSRNPLVLQISGDAHVRSIQQVEPDGSLVFYCAIDEGVVLSIGTPGDLIDGLDACLAGAESQLGDGVLFIGFDCILRRLEIEECGLGPELARVLRHRRIVGFHTYGEQRNGLHINQTFTGLALGTQ